MLSQQSISHASWLCFSHSTCNYCNMAVQKESRKQSKPAISFSPIMERVLKLSGRLHWKAGLQPYKSFHRVLFRVVPGSVAWALAAGLLEMESFRSYPRPISESFHLLRSRPIEVICRYIKIWEILSWISSR